MNLLKGTSPVDLKIPLGLKYGPIGPDNASGGSPFMSNARLTPGTDGQSVQSFPGSRYTLPDLLWDENPVNEHRIAEYSPQEAFNISFGRGLQVVDGKLGWVGQGAFFDRGENWPNDSAGEFYGPSENFHQAVAIDSGSAWTDASGGNVTCSTASAGHRLSGNYSKFVIANTATTGALAYFNVSGTVPAAANAVSLWMFFDASQRVLPAGTFLLRLCSSTGGGGATVSMTINRPLHAGIWLNVNLPWDNGGIAFTFASISLRLLAVPAAGFYTSGSITLRIDSVAYGYTRKLNRMGPHDFPYAANVQDRVIFGGSFCNPVVFDGSARGMGIPDPRFKPTVTTESPTPSVTVTTNLQNLQDKTQWTAGSRVDLFDITGSTATPAPGTGTKYMNMRVKPPRSGGDKIAWRNQDQTIPGTTNATNPTTSIAVWLRYKGANQTLPKNTLRLVFAPDVDLGTSGSGRIQMVIPVDLPHQQFVRVTLPWTQTNDFAVKSTGFILAQPVDRAYLDGDGYFYIGVDDIDALAVPTTVSIPAPGTEGSATGGKYQFCFTFYDSVRDRESNPSPPSDLIEVSANQPMQIDACGYVPELMQLENTPNLPNSNPDPYFVDKIRLYVHKEEWFDPITEDAVFKRATELNVPSSGVIPGISNTGNGNVTNFRRLAGAPVEKWTLTATSSTTFSVVGSVSGSQSAATVGTAYTNSFIAFTIIAGTVAFDDSPTDTFILDIIPRLIIPVTNWFNDDLIFERGEVLSFNNAYPPSCEVAVVDKDRLILAGQKDYSNGTITAENGSYVIIADAASGAAGDTPRFGRWSVDRTITIAGDPNEYDVYEVIPDAPNVGRLEGSKLFIGKDFDPFTQTYKTPYQGTSASGLAYSIHAAKRTVFVSSNTGARGPYCEGFPTENQILLDMPGDEILGAGLVGDYLAVFGRRFVYVALQNQAALNDAEVVFPPYLNPRLVKGAPGLVGKRALASLPGGRIIYLTPEYKIAFGTSDSFAVNIELTNNVLNLFKDGALVDADSVSRAHAVYIPEINQTWFFLVGTS